ncbi:hypothetical protein KI387_011086, partial [Taxus chinensis]
FADLTGSDYSEGAVELAQNLAVRDGFTNINFVLTVQDSLLGRILKNPSISPVRQFGGVISPSPLIEIANSNMHWKAHQ